MTARKPKKLTKDEQAKLEIDEAQRLAVMLAAAEPVGDGVLAPPRYIADPRLAPAMAAWKDLAPLLAKTGRLQAVDRTMFAALCYWQGEWIAAHDDILVRGYWFERKAVAGGVRPWINPSVARRAFAYEQVLALSAKFGLTPLDRVQLNKNRHLANDDEELPLGRPAEPAPAEEAPAPDKWSSLLN